MSEEEYSLEQLNFFRLCHVTTTIITEGLREVFKREWNALYGISHGNWNDNAKNGIDFYSLSSAKEKKMKEMLIIRNGNTLEWDCTCLSFAINCLVKKGLDPKVKKAANDLRTFRNEHFAHVFHDKVPETRFQALIQDVIEAFKDLTLDYSVIEDIKSQSSFSTAELQDIREQLKKERQRNEEPQTFCDLPPKPSHESIQRQNEVNSIIQAMEQLQSLYPNEVTHFYLSGNPGCGKSETARQVGEKVFNNIANETTKTFVATLNASSVDSLLKSFADFARQLKHNEDTIQSIALSNTLTPEDKISNLFGLVKAKIDMFSSWLMIVDNVVDLKKISTFFLSIGKEGKGQVLVTTQDSHAIPFSTTMVHHVSLSKGMSDEDAVCALCSISGKERDQDVTLEVAKALDLQPLALACAGFYMKLINTHRPFSWNECLSKLQKESLQHLQKPYLDSSGQNYPHSMTAAIKLAIDRVIEKDETMMSVFQFLSVLAQEPISLEYVVQYITKCIPNADKDLVAARIVRSSLVLTSEDFQSIRLHQVVFKVIQESMRTKAVGDFNTITKVLELFSSLNVDDREEPSQEFIAKTRSLVPHLFALQEIICTHIQPLLSTLTKEDALTVAKCLSCCIGKICHIHGKLKTAKSCIEMSIMIKKRNLETTDEALLIEQNKLGEILIELAQYREARTCYEQALKSKSSQDEYDDPDNEFYLRALTNQARALAELGDLKKAEGCLNEALPHIKEVKDSFPCLGKMLNNLTVVYYECERNVQAKEFMEKSLSVDQEKYGRNHPCLILRYNDLAIVLQEMGEYDEATNYFEKSLEIAEQFFDKDHPHFSLLYGNLGSVLQDLRQYEEAKKCIQRAVAIDERIYDDNHPTLAINLNSLGLVLRDLRQYEEAKKCMERAVAVDERIHDDNHPTLAIDLNKLGSVLHDLGHYEEAKKCIQRAVAVDERIYDDNHPTLAIDLNNLGLVLQDLRQYEGAKECIQRAVDIAEQIYDESHPTLANHLNSLGLVLQDLRQYEEAKKCIQRAVAIDERIYDESHPTLANHLNSLGSVLQNLGQYEEAKKCIERAVAIDERVYGESHPTLAIDLNNLGSVLQNLGQYEEAKECLERAVSVGRQTFDEKHPYLVTMLDNLNSISM